MSRHYYGYEEIPAVWKQNQLVRCPECGADAELRYRSDSGHWMWVECVDGHEFTITTLRGFNKMPLEPVMPSFYYVSRIIDILRGFGAAPDVISGFRESIEAAFNLLEEE